MLRCCRFSCTSTHTSCYATLDSLALPHIRHATALQVLLHFHTYVILRRCRFSCTSTHTSCYAAVGSLALPDAAVGSLGLPHIRHATPLQVVNVKHSKFKFEFVKRLKNIFKKDPVQRLEPSWLTAIGTSLTVGCLVA